MNLKRKTLRPPVAVAVLVLSAALAGAAASAVAGSRHAERWNVRDVTPGSARELGAVAPALRVPARTTATWCGTPSQADLAPNTRAGHAVHWLYVTASDEPDQLATYAGLIQADADAVDRWWRSQDPTRTPRTDVAPFSCGLQVDLTTIRLAESASTLASVETRFGTIADALEARGFSSPHTKYVAYYDGPVEPDVCGQGGSADSGLGFAIVYVRACLGVPFATTAAHELLHTMGAVADGAPHNCPEPADGHVCDDEFDMMFPTGDETPVDGLALDAGRDDYYGHPGAWEDVQDSPWLIQLDSQVPLTVAISGQGSVAADLPGLRCSRSCSTMWNADTQLSLSAAPASGAKLVRWGSACTGRDACSVTVRSGASVSALFAPLRYRLTTSVAGRGTVSASRGAIACPSRCSARVASHVPLRLNAKPAQGWRLKSWTGSCRGTKAACTLPMTQDSSARAIFVRS